MAVKPEQVLADIKKGQYAPVYFLEGEESFHIDQITAHIEKHALPEADKSFNQSVFYGKDADMKSVLAAARRFPAMAERQTVIVKEAQEMPDFGRAEGRDMLLAYLKKPVPSTILVFAHKHKKVLGTTTLGKSLDKLTVLVQTKKMYDNQISGWVTEYFKSKGKKISPRAAEILAEHVGNDLSRIANEIDKLLLNQKGDQVVGENEVMEQVGVSKEYNVFELQNALAKKEKLKANEIIKYFEANPKANPIIPIVGALFSYFCKIIKTHAHNASGQPKEALAAMLKVSPFFVGDYTLAAKNYPLPKCLSIIGYLKQTDLASKGVDSAADDAALLKELVFKILH